GRREGVQRRYGGGHPDGVADACRLRSGWPVLRTRVDCRRRQRLRVMELADRQIEAVQATRESRARGLALRNVFKTYPNGVEVLKGVNLSIDDGQFLILVGSSGCGKSTLLNMIAGLEPITQGEILIHDRVVNDLPPKSRDIAMVFQSYALYPS